MYYRITCMAEFECLKHTESGGQKKLTASATTGRRPGARSNKINAKLANHQQRLAYDRNRKTNPMALVGIARFDDGHRVNLRMSYVEIEYSDGRCL